MNRENYKREVPNSLLPENARDPAKSFEGECGDLTLKEILAREEALKERAGSNVLMTAGYVIGEKESELNADRKRAEEVAQIVIEEAEKIKGEE